METGSLSFDFVFCCVGYLFQWYCLFVCVFVCLFLGAKCSTWFGSDDGSCFFALWLWQLLRPVRLLRNAHALGINRSCRPGIRYVLWNICYIFWEDGGRGRDPKSSCTPIIG